MDDDFERSGTDGWAWYELGRQAAQGARNREQLIAELTGTAPVPARDYKRAVQTANAWQAECQRLQGVIASLQARVNAQQDDYGKLKTQADRCAADLEYWKDKSKRQSKQTWQISERANRFEEELERLRGS